MPQVSIVIVNWNRKALMAECLRSLERQTFTDFELILVDNGSTDGSLDSLGTFRLPSITTICNPENYGFARAVNQGIKAARGRYIALVNNDAVLDRRWLEEMLGGISRDSRVGICGCKILFLDRPHVIDKVGHLISRDGQNYGRGHGTVDQGQYESVEEILCPDGAAAVFRAEVFESVGLLDEDFFAYTEDIDIGLRAQLGGWKCLYIPSAVVFHRQSATLGPYSPQKIFLVERNRICLVFKLFPWMQLIQVPLYSGLRYLYSLWSLVNGRGLLARAAQDGSAWAILWAVLRAQIAAVPRIPRMLAKRREIHARKRISTQEFTHLLRRYAISVRQLTVLPASSPGPPRREGKK